MAALAMKKTRMIVIVIGILVPAILSEYVALEPSPGPLPPYAGNLEAENQCSAAGLIRTPGCLNRTRFFGQSGELSSPIFSPECCNEAKKISDDCWVKLFPLFPFLAQVIKNFCSRLQSPPPHA
ncbi:hypothetical protein M5689_011551 [Euphorbia peplus]|nr:hypothetical protein M5689_011551 [Euphorbia peplus]